MPISNASNCCKCLAGPWSHELYASCIECNHQFCSSCTPIYLQPTQGPSSHQTARTRLRKRCHIMTATSKVKGRHSRWHPLPPKTGSSLLATATSSFDEQSYLTPDSLRPCVPICTSFSAVTGTLPAPSDPEVELWTCCGCRNGPMTVANHAACTECPHQKCGSCTVEEK